MWHRPLRWRKRMDENSCVKSSFYKMDNEMTTRHLRYDEFDWTDSFIERQTSSHSSVIRKLVLNIMLFRKESCTKKNPHWFSHTWYIANFKALGWAQTSFFWRVRDHFNYCHIVNLSLTCRNFKTFENSKWKRSS